MDPCVDIAVRSGLELDTSTGGIAVNQQLEVTRPRPSVHPILHTLFICVLWETRRPASSLLSTSLSESINHHPKLDPQAIGNVFVAGGVASYYDAALGRRRVEMFDHSINSGILAGKNMTADEARPKRRYTHQPSYRSLLKDIDVVCDVMGEIDAKMHTVGIWVNNPVESEDEAETYQRGIIYYLKENKCV